MNEKPKQSKKVKRKKKPKYKISRKEKIIYKKKKKKHLEFHTYIHIQCIVYVRVRRIYFQ